MPNKVKPTKRQPNPEPAKIGRPPIVFTDEQLKTLTNLAQIGCSMGEIAAVMDCSVDTLERRFADVIKKGDLMGRSSLRRAQFKAALEGNVTMQIWLGKVKLGQSETVVEQTSGKGGNRAPQFFRIGGQLLEI